MPLNFLHEANEKGHLSNSCIHSVFAFSAVYYVHGWTAREIDNLITSKRGFTSRPVIHRLFYFAISL